MTAGSPDRIRAARHQMVASQLRSRGIHHPGVLAAFEQVPRHRFINPNAADQAYEDHPLPIGDDQTISQPYIVAFMLQTLRLRPGERVLEIGAGCGYQTALLRHMDLRVCAMEVRPRLAEMAIDHLAGLAITDVDLRLGDGALGWPAPVAFDAIVVSAAAAVIPTALEDQLCPTGRLIMPVGAWQQELVLVESTPDGLTRRPLAPVRFVPLQSP